MLCNLKVTTVTQNSILCPHVKKNSHFQHIRFLITVLFFLLVRLNHTKRSHLKIKKNTSNGIVRSSLNRIAINLSKYMKLLKV